VDQHGRIIFTIGHSTRSFDEFVDILRTHGVAALADVRTIPRSRRHPQFNADSLALELTKAGIEYLPFKPLGGLRKPRPDTINTGWRHEGFRGYADYMQTPQFHGALQDLTEHAARKPTAIMCAEALPWRCHRSLIADALLMRGWNVSDIHDAKTAKPHILTSFARIAGGAITYPEPTLFEI
jgi:uncharacterized protein (DUF488 family)